MTTAHQAAPQKILLTEQRKVTGALVKRWIANSIVSIMLIALVILWIRREFGQPESVSTYYTPVPRPPAQYRESPAAQPPLLIQPKPRSRNESGDAMGGEWATKLDLAGLDLEGGWDHSAKLGEARSALDEGRLIQPPGDNALQTYLSMLQASPNDEDALKGLAEVALRLVEMSNAALEEDRLSEAIRLFPYLEAARADPAAIDTVRKQIEVERKIEQLLSQAQSDLHDGRLVVPEDDSALYFFHQVIALDGENPTANLGLTEVERQLLQLATEAAQQLSFEYADMLLAQAGAAREGNSDAVSDARTEIMELRTGKRDQYLDQAVESIKIRDFDTGLRWIEKAEALHLKGRETLQARAVLANARLYGMHHAHEEFSDPFLDGSAHGPDLVVIPIGAFQMGSQKGDEEHRANEGPVHTVRMRTGFALSRTETTLDSFRRFIDDQSYITDAERNGKSSVYSQRTGRVVRRKKIGWQHTFDGSMAGEDHAVMHVSWNDATKYTEWLGEKTGHTYRLPSEAELEYAMRAGGTDRYWWGDGSPTTLVGNIAGDGDSSERRRFWRHAFENYTDEYWGPSPAGHFQPNPWGIYDIAGNLSEWVADCWHESYARAPSDGSAWINRGCEKRVIKGGSWGSAPERVRSAYRTKAVPETTSNRVGFRVVREL